MNAYRVLGNCVDELRQRRGTWLASAGVALLVTACLTATAQAQLSKGPNSPGAAFNDPAFGIPLWTDPSQALTSDDVDASASPGSNNTQYLHADNFNFTIPAPALIEGIEVSIERHCLAGVIKDSRVRIVNGGVVGTTERGDLVTPWPTGTDAIKTYGSNSDLWGETWTAADINASDFGAVISVNGNGDAAFIDHIAIKVYYSLCQPTPQAGCRLASKSLLLVKDNTSDDTKDKFIFKWIKGAATSQSEFGNPTSTAVYATCVYENGVKSFSLVVPPGPLWSQIGTKGYKYKDLTGTFDGVQKIIVKGSTDPKAKILVKGRGVAVPDPLPPALTLPVLVQVINSDSGLCWEASFNTPNIKKNTADFFKGKN